MQFFGEDFAAGLILGQGGAALTGKGQQAHGLRMGFLLPRLQRQFPEGVLQGGGVLGPRGVVRGQPGQRLHRLAVQPFAREHQPFLKGGTITQVEAAQQIAPVQVGGLGQVGLAGGAPFLVPMAVGAAGGQQADDYRYIHLDIAGRN